MKPRRTPNPKKHLAAPPETASDVAALAEMARTARYVGNPDHKRNPGDFGLSPPSRPRMGKSLCDSVEIFSRKEAEKLLQNGIERGVISVQIERGWPRIVWAVRDGAVLEARLDNAEQGTYHGYPLDDTDPFVTTVLERWNTP